MSTKWSKQTTERSAAALSLSFLTLVPWGQQLPEYRSCSRRVARASDGTLWGAESNSACLLMLTPRGWAAIVLTPAAEKHMRREFSRHAARLPNFNN